jgi:hypothetical protein
MPDLGVRLQLHIGAIKPAPAPYEVMDALRDVEVTNKDQDFDGFQINFSLGKDSLLEYGILASGLLNPPNRIVIAVNFGVQPEVLIDGIIEKHSVRPSNKPGESTLNVYGKDISVKLSLEHRNKSYPNHSASGIVNEVLKSYMGELGLTPKVTDTTNAPNKNERIPSQQKSDLDCIRDLARKHGHVFYIEPTSVLGENIAYWGKDNRQSGGQPPLTLNMGPDTNVDNPLSFDFDSMGPVEPHVSIVDPITKRTIDIPLPAGLHPSLTKQPAAAFRKTLPRNTANLNFIEAVLRALSSVNDSSDAVKVRGDLDAVRYGRALRPRRLVDVRGSGQSYDGAYYVEEVTHRITRGEYLQSFVLRREGRGALSQRLSQ